MDGVVVASPTVYHPANTVAALEAKLPVLLEKPVAKSAAEAKIMLRANKPPAYRYCSDILGAGGRRSDGCANCSIENAIGKLRHVQFHMSAHLADWHPWEPYQEFFMASAAQGGGALLDESHWIDLMVWLFGRPQQLIGRVEKISRPGD